MPGVIEEPQPEEKGFIEKSEQFLVDEFDVIEGGAIIAFDKVENVVNGIIGCIWK